MMPQLLQFGLNLNRRPRGDSVDATLAAVPGRFAAHGVRRCHGRGRAGRLASPSGHAGQIADLSPGQASEFMVNL